MREGDITTEAEIERATVAVRYAEASLITAGAGMGVDSGLPDFRGTEGFWKAYPAIARLGLRFDEIANPEWFEKAPELAWAFYGHRLNLYRATPPHAGFRQLLRVADLKPHGYFVFTSNVDGHFQRTGFSPDRIVECHGSIHHFQCRVPCSEDIWDAAHEQVNVEEERFKAMNPLPTCPNCGGLARPNVMMFDDWTWNPGRTRPQELRLLEWLRGLKKHQARLTVMEIGAGTAVPTVRLHSEEVAEKFGATLIRINLREPEGPAGTVQLRLNGAEAIRRVITDGLD